VRDPLRYVVGVRHGELLDLPGWTEVDSVPLEGGRLFVHRGREAKIRRIHGL
jgi:hypothetical protein